MLTMQTPKFISFEGTEGVGKTTTINLLSEHLQSLDIPFIRTREPGGSPFAETLRDLLLDPNTHISDDTELLMMFAARSDHLEQVILPALDTGKWVICDRFTDSTIAYQGFGRGNGNPELLSKINSLIEQFVFLLPMHTFWLDLPITEGIQRAKKRSLADRFEQEKLSFFERVYQGYNYQHTHNPNRIQRIDASGSPEQILSAICQHLQLS